MSFQQQGLWTVVWTIATPNRLMKLRKTEYQTWPKIQLTEEREAEQMIDEKQLTKGKQASFYRLWIIQVLFRMLPEYIPPTIALFFTSSYFAFLSRRIRESSGPMATASKLIGILISIIERTPSFDKQCFPTECLHLLDSPGFSLPGPATSPSTTELLPTFPTEPLGCRSLEKRKSAQVSKSITNRFIPGPRLFRLEDRLGTQFTTLTQVGNELSVRGPLLLLALCWDIRRIRGTTGELRGAIGDLRGTLITLKWQKGLVLATLLAGGSTLLGYLIAGKSFESQ
ncbi:hypothetical protein HOY82DRAFT_604257 [Tuber indicum]|nr:hypothetical protein HOY82DRAFT_604257 [Tuber indicum]